MLVLGDTLVNADYDIGFLLRDKSKRECDCQILLFCFLPPPLPELATSVAFLRRNLVN